MKLFNKYHREGQIQGVKSDWNTIRVLRARIRAALKAVSNSIPETRIPSAKMINKRIHKIVALVEMLDELERECPFVDWTRGKELLEIYCSKETIPELVSRSGHSGEKKGA